MSEWTDIRHAPPPPAGRTGTPQSARLLEAARLQRGRILALAELLGEIDEIEPDVGADVITEAILLFHDLAAAASAGAALLDHLLTLDPPAAGLSAAAGPDCPERTSHDHFVA